MKHLLFLSLSLCLFSFANAQKQPLQSKEITATLEKCYDRGISVKELVAEQFANVTFRLDLDRNILYRVSPSGEKALSFSIDAASGELKFTDDTRGSKLILTKLDTNDRAYMLTIKEHATDCFTYQVIF